MVRWGTMVLLAAATAALSAGGPAVAAEVTLLRGGISDTVAIGSPGALPAVLHGTTGLTPLPAAIAEEKTPKRAQPRRVITAGEVLWVVAEDGSVLRACRLRGTGYVGEKRIVCTSRR